MILREWDDLPEFMKNEDVRKYYELLQKRKASLYVKRVFDLIAAVMMLMVLSPVILIVSVLIKIDSSGPILFKQTRVTQYGSFFTILKFRTMINNADKIGSQVTVNNDSRVTRLGRFLRKYRLDEIPQLFNIIKGDMSFVGTRPEVVKYVEKYTDEMKATLLLPAGVTSNASIEYKDEEQIMRRADDVDMVYMNTVLPGKMYYNLKDIKNFCFFADVQIMVNTILNVFIKKMPDKKDNIKVNV